MEIITIRQHISGKWQLGMLITLSGGAAVTTWRTMLASELLLAVRALHWEYQYA
jgi:hypothetical protein